MKNLKALLKYIEGNYKLVILSILAANFVALFTAIIPIFLKYAVDNIIGHSKESSNDIIVNLIDGVIPKRVLV